MENLYKLADHLIDEADKLAAMVMRDPSNHLKELDIIVAYCDAHSGICESIEIDEKLDSKSEEKTGYSGLFSDNPRKRRR